MTEKYNRDAGTGGDDYVPEKRWSCNCGNKIPTFIGIPILATKCPNCDRRRMPWNIDKEAA